MITLPENKHITKGYTLAEIKAQIEEGEYSAELLLQHLCANANEIQRENAQLREALLWTTEFARELQGEWKWKDGAGGKNSLDYRGLCDAIALAEPLLPNAGSEPHGQPEKPKS